MKSDWLCLAEDLATYLAPLRRLGRRQLSAGPDHDELLAKSRALVAALHPTSMRLRLVDSLVLTASTRTLRFERVDGDLPPFRPGQYVSLTLQIGAGTTTRPYSISSCPDAGHLDLTVKRAPDGFVSPFLLEQSPGWEVQSSGPVGSFVHEPLRDRGPLVLLSGGSGITPFMSMLRHFAARGFPAPVQLIHASRHLDDVLFGDEFEALAAQHEELSALSVISRPPPGYTGASGRIDAALIADVVGDVTGRSFFVCGPDGFIAHVVLQLLEMGVQGHQIRRESFGPPDDVTQVHGWPADVAAGERFEVEVAGAGALTVRADEPLLNAMEREGMGVPAVCRTGECAECRVRVVSGEVFSLPNAGVREADQAQGFVHACVAYACSDLCVDPGR